ncbi:helix-turn-helix transcriptional regulator [Actinophytocola sp.]|uniref:helix-turn-helix domain-containing transcriptional regulator n=1 Tax=Actinophytocola sp. TaxID=1872138 RepID=UPI002D481E6E|nr:helix-turn-helix transcriptional regulator [Actinophytocola sp.]HYQ66730.1 helix-turn-helix transcriptional regulator [Actinophytocola sp.]
MAAAPTTYWDDLVEDLKDPEFLRAYLTESLRVETIDRLVNALDEAREELGLSKADLARAISSEPAVIRRLLSSGHRNPTIGTIAEVAAALGLRVALVPMSDDEREQVAETLRAGVAKDVDALARSVEAKRPSPDMAGV